MAQTEFGKKIALGTAISLLPLIIIFSLVIVKSGTLSKSYPGSGFFELKRLSEKFHLILLTGNKESKLKYLVELLRTRAVELQFVVENNRASEIENASSRYVTTGGLILSSLEHVDENTKNSLKNTLLPDLKLLENLRDRFKANSAEWILIQQSIDTLNRIISQL